MYLPGFQNYDLQESRKSASMTLSGKKLLREMIDRGTEAVEKLQESMAAPRHRCSRSTRAAVLLVPAETLALLALKTMLDNTYHASRPDKGVQWINVASAIGRCAQTELNFRNWIEKSKHAAKEYAKAEGLASVPPSQAERMLKDTAPSRTQIQRWQKTISDLQAYDWDTATRCYVGDALITTLCAALPEHFESQSGKNAELKDAKCQRILSRGG